MKLFVKDFNNGFGNYMASSNQTVALSPFYKLFSKSEKETSLMWA